MQVTPEKTESGSKGYYYATILIAEDCDTCKGVGDLPPQAGKPHHSYQDSGEHCPDCDGMGIIVTPEGEEEIEIKSDKDKDLDAWCVSKGL